MDNDKLMIVMQVHTVDGVLLNQRAYDFLNPTCRQRIAKTAWWAMHNGHTLTTRPQQAGEQVEEVFYKTANV